MRSSFNKDSLTVRYNTSFSKVLTSCKKIERNDQDGTWIHQKIEDSFLSLHEMGYAHSVETWDGDELIGGLYGLAIGKIFFGESMFAKKSNASKFAFIHLAKKLEQQGFTMIDCQQDTPHLRSLGAKLISKEQFLKELKQNTLVEDLGHF